MARLGFILGAAALALSACATTTTVPATQPVTTTDKVLPADYIAECNHRGAPPAQLSYPAGWQDRLDRVIDGGAGDELMGGPQVSAVQDRGSQPITPPVPAYPAAQAGRQQEARCDILFDVALDGTPKNILTACSSPEFTSSARKAVERLRFSPKSLDGRTVERWNIVYPLIYCLDQ